MKNSIKETFSQFLIEVSGISDSAINDYYACWETVEFKNKEVITAPGQTERYLYFILTGVHKSYYLHTREHIIAFAYPPSFSGVIDSFLTQSESKYYLESIGDSTALRISYNDHSRILEMHRDLDTFFRKLTENYLRGIIQRLYEVMALPIEERFTLFVKRSPHLLQMVPQKDLAAYLRIDPTNFSKLINRIKI